MPIPPLVVAGLAQAGSNVVGNIMSNRANKKIAKEQREFDLAMWEKSNLYNSPVEQMKRLRQAGLNPNLVYGTGNVSGQTSSPAPKASTPQMRNIFEGANLQAPLEMLGAYQNIKGQKLVNDLTEAKIKTENARAFVEQLRPELMQADILLKNSDQKNRYRLQDYQITKMKADTDNAILQSKIMNYDLANMKPIQRQAMIQDIMSASIKSQLDQKGIQWYDQKVKSELKSQELQQMLMELDKSIKIMEQEQKDMEIGNYRKYAKEGLSPTGGNMMETILRQIVNIRNKIMY